MAFRKKLLCVVMFLLVFSCAELPEESQYDPYIVPENMTVEEKKQRFEALMVPPVKRVYQELNFQFKETELWMKKGRYPQRIAALKEEYKADSDQQLLAALKPHPPSIVLGQAALESAWGTSRFFVEANNVFGVWSFDSEEPRIAADVRRGNKTIWVKKYNSLEDAVRDYYRVLARGHAHQHFRDLRLKTDNPYKLARKLDQYSEKREVYIEELISLISYNKLTRFDPVVYKKQ